MFDMVGDYLSSAWSSVSGKASDVVESFSESVERLKKTASEFMSVFLELEKIQKSANLSQAEKSAVDKIISRGESVKAAVSTLTKSIDGISSVLPRGLLSGVVRDGGLGFLPLLPVAAIAAAIAVMTAWLSDAYVELERLKLAESVRVGGGNPATVLGGGLPSKWVLLGGGVGVLLLVYLLARKK